MRRGVIVSDRFDALAIKGGMIQLKKLPPGNYRLRMKYDSATNRSGYRTIELRNTEGATAASVLVGKDRHLEDRPNTPLHIALIEPGKTKLQVQLDNFDDNTRVHILADRYQPEFNAFSLFSDVRDIEPWSRTESIRKSVYMEGRKIGDEYQYILDRKYAKKYTGVMLERPSLAAKSLGYKNDSQQFSSR